MDFYVKANRKNGYLRDGCVYRGISRLDTMTLNVRSQPAL